MSRRWSILYLSLYEKYPEYIVKAANRDAVQGRGGTQLVLDMANPKVQDLVFEVVDTLMTKYPEIDYIKWDANAPIMNHGSQYQSADNQSHLYIDYHKGLEKTLQRIRAKYPELTIQACASGGGRANWGILPYFDEFWVSDNTDALQRIYMQWGTSLFLPRDCHGFTYLGKSEPSDQPYCAFEIPHGCGYERTSRHGDPAQEYD